jgi:hypothetical protein
MKPIFRGKIWIILLALVSMAGLIALSSSLGDMEFEQPTGSLIERFFDRSSPLFLSQPIHGPWTRYVFIALFVIAFLLSMIPLRPQDSNKNLFHQLIRVVIFVIVVMYVLGRAASNNTAANGGETGAPPPLVTPAAPPPYLPPQVSSQWEFWITAAIIAIVGIVVVVITNRLVDRWLASRSNLEEYVEIARTTLNELSNTQESRNAIIRCYVRMSNAVLEHRGLARGIAMTPAEFATELERAGLPHDSVQTLTRVFERVRYGGQSAKAEDVKEAKQCLTSILKACEAKP